MPNNQGSDRQCGPTLFISIGGAVLAAFVLLGLFSYRNNQTKPQAAKPAAVSTLPTR